MYVVLLLLCLRAATGAPSRRSLSSAVADEVALFLTRRGRAPAQLAAAAAAVRSLGHGEDGARLHFELGQACEEAELLAGAARHYGAAGLLSCRNPRPEPAAALALLLHKQQLHSIGTPAAATTAARAVSLYEGALGAGGGASVRANFAALLLDLRRGCAAAEALLGAPAGWVASPAAASARAVRGAVQAAAGLRGAAEAWYACAEDMLRRGAAWGAAAAAAPAGAAPPHALLRLEAACALFESDPSPARYRRVMAARCRQQLAMWLAGRAGEDTATAVGAAAAAAAAEEAAGVAAAAAAGNASRCTQACEVRDAAALSFHEFWHGFALRRRPLILRGSVGAVLPGLRGAAAAEPTADAAAGNNVTAALFLRALLRSCGASTLVTPHTHAPHARTWARLTTAPPLELGELARLYGAHDNSSSSSSSSSPDVLFDWSLPVHCPAFLRASELVIPRFFANDFLRHVRGAALWPSLFISPAHASRSALHTDALGTSFWQLLVDGRKRWLIYARDADYRRLRPDLVHQTFGADDPLATHAAGTCPHECVAHAGDIVFVPGGLPHAVQHLSPTIALAANFVDAANLGLARRALEPFDAGVPPGGEGDAGAGRAAGGGAWDWGALSDLRRHFAAKTLGDAMDMEPEDTPWRPELVKYTVTRG